MPLTVLTDSDSTSPVSSLDRAWDSRDTFVLIPSKTAVSKTWLTESLAHIETRFPQDHFCLLTSGTTGLPKLMIGARSRALSLCSVLHECQLSASVEETIVSLPLAYCYAFVNQWIWARHTGRRLIWTPGLADAAAFSTALHQARNAMLCLVGSQLPLLFDLARNHAFDGVIRIHFAGGRFPQESLPQLARTFPNAAVFNNFGCAEAMPRLTLRTAASSSTASVIGHPIPGVRIRAAEDSRLEFLSPYRAVAQTSPTGLRHFSDEEWIATGDLARQLEDGSWLLIGRTGEVFKRYGEKISLPVIHATVAAQWNGQAACYLQQDSFGEQGYVLVLSPPPDPPVLGGILQALRQHHPRSHWPLRIVALSQMPLLPNGKIDTSSLPTASDPMLLWSQRI